MINIEMLMSNEGARAAQTEIRSFLSIMTKKMMGPVPGDFLEPDETGGPMYDKKGTATLGYVVLREFLGLIQSEIERQDREAEAERRQRKAANAPTVKEKWERV